MLQLSRERAHPPRVTGTLIGIMNKQQNKQQLAPDVDLARLVDVPAATAPCR